MGWAIKSSQGGSVILSPTDTVSNVTITAPALSGVAICGTDTTGAAILPSGQTFQRPTSPTDGMTRINATTGRPEWYNSATSQWISM